MNTTTVMIVTLFECDCVPQLDWSPAAAAQTPDERIPLLQALLKVIRVMLQLIKIVSFSV